MNGKALAWDCDGKGDAGRLVINMSCRRGLCDLVLCETGGVAGSEGSPNKKKTKKQCENEYSFFNCYHITPTW